MKSAYQFSSQRDSFQEYPLLHSIPEEDEESDTFVSDLCEQFEPKRARSTLETTVQGAFRNFLGFLDNIVNPKLFTSCHLTESTSHLLDEFLPVTDDGLLWTFVADQLICDYQVGHATAFRNGVPEIVTQHFQANLIEGDYVSHMLWTTEETGEILNVQSLSSYTCAPMNAQHTFSPALSGYWRPVHFGPATSSWLDFVIRSIDEGVDLQGPAIPKVMQPFVNSLISIFTLGFSTQEVVEEDVNVAVEGLKKQGYSPLETFRYAVAHWEKFLDSPLVVHFTNLIGCAIVAGFLPVDYGELHINAIRVYQVSNLARLHSFVDFTRALVGSLNYFVEAVVASWEAGSLEPFLMERTNSKVLDEAYEEVNVIMIGIPTGEYYKGGGDWSTAMHKVDRTLAMYQQAIKSVSGQTWLRNIFSSRIINLQRWRFELGISKKGGSLRSQPFCAMFYGASRCGKSAISSMTMKYHAAIQKIVWDPSLVANITADEKHHNSIHNGTRFFFYDDVCNRPLAYDPSYGIASVLQAVNNVQFVANKAEIELKGMVMPDPIGVYGTTNVGDFMATKISLEPESIYLRIIRVHVVVRPEYIQDGTSGAYDRMKFEADPRYCYFKNKRFDDAHYIAIERWDRNSGYKPIFSEEHCMELSHLNVAEYLFHMGKLLKQHHSRQEDYLSNQEAVTFDIEEEDSHEEFPLPTSIVEQVGDRGFTRQAPMFPRTQRALANGFRAAIMMKLGDFPSILRFLTFLTGYDFLVAQTVSILIDHFSSCDEAQWWFWIPDSWWSEKLFKRLAPVLQDTQIRKELIKLMKWRYRWIALICLSVYFRWYRIMGVASAFLVANLMRGQVLRFSAYRLIVNKRKAVQEVAQAYRKNMSPYLKWILEWIPWVAAAGGAIAGLRWLMGPDNTFTFGSEIEKPRDWHPSDQQAFMGMTEADMRAKEQVRNQWQEKVVTAVSGFRNPNMTGDQLTQLVIKNTSRYKVYQEGEWKEMCHLTWLTTDICVLPAHVIPKNSQKWRIYDSDDKCARKDVVVSPMSFYKSLRGDVALAHIKYRSKKSLIQYLDYLPAELMGTRIRLEKGSCSPHTFGVRGGRVTNAEGFEVIEWISPHPSEEGDCGAAYVRTGRNPSIVGFHYAARSDNYNIQRSAMFTEIELKTFIKNVLDNASTLVSANAPDQWGFKGPNGFSVEEKPMPANDIAAQVDWLMENTEAGQELAERNASSPEIVEVDKPEFEPPCIEKKFVRQAVPIGTAGRSAYYKSRCVDTLMAEAVRERLGIHHGKPKFGRSMYPKSAMYTFNGSCNLPPSMLEWAAQDYLSMFKLLPRYLLEDLCPLTREEILNGKDGVRYIDALNFLTSMGEGFPGGKKAWVIEYLDSLSGHIRKEFLQEVWDEVDKALAALEAGKRVPFIFRATPKDEATPITKDKVRIFMVGQITCILLVRKYFTPVCRLIQMTTGISECAVGINATSVDWEHVQQHLDRFSNVFDGDHSKYDLVKNAATSAASYKIMIELAAMGNYTAQDLTIMTMLVNDLVYPLTSYAGLLYQLDGSTPSGIPVTVIVNGLDNSLMNRCAFLYAYPRSKVGDFRKYVSHINYGDDFINAVSFWRRRFNFITMRDFLASYGLKITPGVKDAEGRKFVDRNKIVFLKRHSVKLPELDYRVGALEYASIFKSLETVLYSKNLSSEQALAVNIDGALRELVYHGQEAFYQEQKWLRDQATQHGIAHLCVHLNTKYEDLLRSLQKL
jgi:hypothetical protein